MQHFVVRPCSLTLQLGLGTMTASNHVLGVTISSDLKGRSHCVRSRTTSDAQGRTTSYDHVRRRTTTNDVVVRPCMYYVCVVVLMEHVQSIRGIHTTRDVVRRRTYKSAQKSSMSRFLRFTTYDVVRRRA